MASPCTMPAPRGTLRGGGDEGGRSSVDKAEVLLPLLPLLPIRLLLLMPLAVVRGVPVNCSIPPCCCRYISLWRFRIRAVLDVVCDTDGEEEDGEEDGCKDKDDEEDEEDGNDEEEEEADARADMEAEAEAEAEVEGDEGPLPRRAADAEEAAWIDLQLDGGLICQLSWSRWKGGVWFLDPVEALTPALSTIRAIAEATLLFFAVGLRRCCCGCW